MKTVMVLFLCLWVGVLPLFSKDYAERYSQQPEVVGEVVHLDVNRIDLALENNGSVGDNGQSWYPSGQTSLSFLFSGGFATTAYINGELRASWLVPTARINEWQPGKWGMDPGDPRARFYVVSENDGPGQRGLY